jgi:hypothetical protein
MRAPHRGTVDNRLVRPFAVKPSRRKSGATLRAVGLDRSTRPSKVAHRAADASLSDLRKRKSTSQKSLTQNFGHSPADYMFGHEAGGVGFLTRTLRSKIDARQRGIRFRERSSGELASLLGGVYETVQPRPTVTLPALRWGSVT